VRSPLAWILAGVGILAVLLIGAALAGNDEGETVPAGDWAQSVCGAVGVWRGEIEDIVDAVRVPNAESTSGEEPQSETPQGRTGFVRKSVERAVGATETLVVGIDNAGVPETENGEEAADDISTWAERALGDLEEAQDSLENEADTLEEGIEQFQDATGAIGSALVGGVQTITDVARLDPELAAAFRDASTCQQLREERGAR
jgi:hypothetical protein